MQGNALSGRPAWPLIGRPCMQAGLHMHGPLCMVMQANAYVLQCICMAQLGIRTYVCPRVSYVV